MTAKNGVALSRVILFASIFLVLSIHTVWADNPPKPKISASTPPLYPEGEVICTQSCPPPRASGDWYEYEWFVNGNGQGRLYPGNPYNCPPFDCAAHGCVPGDEITLELYKGQYISHVGSAESSALTVQYPVPEAPVIVPGQSPMDTRGVITCVSNCPPAEYASATLEYRWWFGNEYGKVGGEWKAGTPQINCGEMHCELGETFELQSRFCWGGECGEGSSFSNAITIIAGGEVPAPVDAPVIASDPSPMTTGGVITCSENCPPGRLPVHPEYSAPSVEYQWLSGSGESAMREEGWHSSIPQKDCGGLGCEAGDRFVLQSRFCWGGECGEAVSSNEIEVTGSAPSETCANEGEACSASMKCCLPHSCGTGNRCETASNKVCGSDEFQNVLFLSALAGLGMVLLIAVIYMFGEASQNPKLITWSKYELFQVFVSGAVVLVIISLLSTFCAIDVSEIGALGGSLPYIYQGQYGNVNIYDGASLYLENLMGAGLRNIAAIRFNLGAYEIRTTYNQFECDSICWLSMASTNVAKHGGETMKLGITNNLLGTATVSYLSAVFQYFTLQYILNGLFLVFLPMAVIIRSIPFMRNFGGALIGIIIALYVLYPLMLVIDAVVLPSLAQGSGSPTLIYDRDGTNCAGIGVFMASNGAGYVECKHSTNDDGVDYEWEMGGKGIGEDDLPRPAPELEGIIKANVLIFMASVFLPAINFIVIAAFARDLSRFLGDEADISRLGRMV